MKFKLLIVALLAMNIGLPGAYAGEDTGTAADRPAGGVASLVTVNATVTSINHETRKVTLQGADGAEIALTVGEEVKNLPQVQVGDHVQIAYYEAVNFKVLGAGEAEPAAAAISALETAPPGRKPSGSMSTKQSIVATVEAVDKDNQTVTLKGPKGNTRTVKARNPDNLDKVAVGDRVLITLTNAVAVDVTETPPEQ
jgi:hypothetical protein